jgi:hypothetical protein
VSWDGGPLAANTDYIVRVRHNGTGISSAWSAVVAFKTMASFPPPSLGKGEVYTWDRSVLTPLNLPVKAVNVGSSYNGLYVCGVDGNLYEHTLAAGTIASTINMGKLTGGATAVEMVSAYNKTPKAALDATGRLHVSPYNNPDANTPNWKLSAKTNKCTFLAGCMSKDYIALAFDDGDFGYLNDQDFVSARAILAAPWNAKSYVAATITNATAGYALASDGTLIRYAAGAVTTALTGVRAISTFDPGAVCALKLDGTLWAFNSGRGLTGSAGTTFEQVGALSGYTSPLFSAYQATLSPADIFAVHAGALVAFGNSATANAGKPMNTLTSTTVPLPPGVTSPRIGSTVNSLSQISLQYTTNAVVAL